MSDRALGICVALAALAADQVSKALVVADAEMLARGLPVLPGFDLVFHRNEGVTFGLLQGLPWWVLVMVAAVVVLYLAVCLARSTGSAEASAYGAVIGGALGNIADRLRFGGVTDFLDFYVGQTHWPAFNLADVFVVCGVGLLLIVSGRKPAGSARASR